MISAAACVISAATGVLLLVMTHTSGPVISTASPASSHQPTVTAEPTTSTTTPGNLRSVQIQTLTPQTLAQQALVPQAQRVLAPLALQLAHNLAHIPPGTEILGYTATV